MNLDYESTKTRAESDPDGWKRFGKFATICAVLIFFVLALLGIVAVLSDTKF